MLRRPYHLNATMFIGDGGVTLEVHSNRKHYHLPAMLMRRGLQVRQSSWFEFSPLSPEFGKRMHGTGFADAPTRFYAMYEIEKCRFCPHGETDLCMMNIYRIIDSINAKWFP